MGEEQKESDDTYYHYWPWSADWCGYACCFLFGVSYAMEKAHNNMVRLSKSEKMKKILENLLDVTREYICEKTCAGVAIFMNGLAMVGNGDTTMGHGTTTIARGVSNGAATIVTEVKKWGCHHYGCLSNPSTKCSSSCQRISFYVFGLANILFI